MKSCFTLLLFLLAARTFAGGAYYLDAQRGDDSSSGTSESSPWKSFARLQKVRLQPGDSVCFRRGSVFSGKLVIAGSGMQDKYIVLTDYGNASDPSPSFTNPVFADGNYGNCIRVEGSWVIVEDLSFFGTAAYSPVEYDGKGWVVWEMGAIHLSRSAEHCIVRHNEIRDCVAGIRSNGAFALIGHNYIHDCNRVLKEWNWGPLGIWMGADHQEVCCNRIVNYSAVDPHIGWGPNSYGGGADGGALEIDDARYDKSDISIHDNETRDNQGFLEVTWKDVKKGPKYRNFRIYRNFSDDFQQFVALWRGESCRIEDNTIIRRKVNANEWGVFNITQDHSHNIIRGNTIVTDKGVVIFNVGRKGTARPETLIVHNTYIAGEDSLRMGYEGPGDSAVYGNARFPIARNRKALSSITTPPDASTTAQFAADELARYLSKITGAAFPVNKTSIAAAGAGQISAKALPSIRLVLENALPLETYRITTQNKDLVLAAGSDRALLYAVYDLLHRLGCVWAAPNLDIYNGHAEFIPRKASLEYDATLPVREEPALKYRKLDVEEGRTHTIENLRQIIEWMPKVRLNVLQIPLNYQGAGRVRWDNWREALTPELKKRGLLIEVGGHGYQNFISAKMADGTLFHQHPDWFGCNRTGSPDSTENLVFNTANPEAVQYFLGNIRRYLLQHPEIDIFDCWPPDVAKWAECPAMAALGTAVDRQATLMDQVDSMAKKTNPGLTLGIIAYGQVLEPPQHSNLNEDILVDICPINQTFEQPIYDTSNPANTPYFRAMNNWRRQFTGDRGIYTYYRKYAWRSLPVMLPHYMQDELRWYKATGFRGISTYAEPGDWYTYELNHYALAALAWDPETQVDSLIDELLKVRYGSAKPLALSAYQTLEEVVRKYNSIPYTRLKSTEELDSAATALKKCRAQLTDRISHGTLALPHPPSILAPSNTQPAANLRRLTWILDYAIGDLEILTLKTTNAPAATMETRIKELVTFLENHRDEGLFVLHKKDNLPTYINHYKGLK